MAKISDMTGNQYNITLDAAVRSKKMLLLL